MISIKPAINHHFSCPACNSQTKLESIHLTGIRFLGNIKCESCKKQFYSDFPIGHAFYYPFSIDENQKLYGEPKYKWFGNPLINTVKNRSNKKVVELIKVENADKVIIVNCLDYLYGHVLLKLFNIYFYIKSNPDHKIILIIPANFTWLIPPNTGIAEVWVVKARLSELKDTWYTELDAVFHEQIKNYSHVLFSPAYSHPPLHELDISFFSKVKPFNIDNFNSNPLIVTFIWREDRLWHSNKLELLAYQVAHKFKLNPIKRFLIYLQQKKYINTASILKKHFPDSVINIVGLGRKTEIPNYINDYRENNISKDTEQEWCKIYAASNLTIGIHGSNMLLPSAHSAGFIELLPKDRIGNITQDLFCKYDGSKMVFLGRLVHEYITPKSLAFNIKEMYNSYASFNHYSQHTYTIDPNSQQ